MYISPKYERVELLSADVITSSNGDDVATPSYKGTNCDVFEGTQSVFGGTGTTVAADINSILRG